VEYFVVEWLVGFLLVVCDVCGVGWDEYVCICMDDGEVCYGFVLEVDDDIVVIEVFEGMDGM